MGISSVGSVNSYMYNMTTGKLSTKDGSRNEFVDYFNGELDGKDSDTLNGFDKVNKAGIRKMMDMIGWGMIGGDRLIGCEGEEVEITSESVDALTTVYYLNGEKILTMVSAISYPQEDIDVFTTVQQPYKTHNATGYDPATNRLSIGVGDEFDFGNGLKFLVKEDHIWVEGEEYDTHERNVQAEKFSWGLSALIHFGDQQAFSNLMYAYATPEMMLEFLKQMGVDVSRQFMINDTVCEIVDGKIREVGNKVGVPNSIHQKAVAEYEKYLYIPLHER